MTEGLRLLMTLDAVGGVWRYAMDLAGALRPEGVETVFLGFGPRPTDAQQAEAARLGTLDWTDAPLDWLVGDAGALSEVPTLVAQAARRHGADLLHLNLPTHAAGLDTDRPVLVVSHSCVTTWFRAVRGTGLPPGWEWQGDLNAQGLARADAIVAPSHAHAAALHACYGPVPRLRVVPNATAAPLGETKGEPFVIASGRWWDEGKNGALLDEAAENTNLPIHLLGPTHGPNGATFAARHALPRGELPHAEAVALMRRAGIFCSPSLYEPFGLAVAEAARMALPLVLSDIPTFRELWSDAAVFVPPRDPERLAATLDALACDPTERRRLGEAAQARSRRFTPEAQAAAMLRLYADLVPQPVTQR
ncbi:glycosyltransferase family 4 protein [Rubellimicrobium aerolatum]|uniref:Glycosyltransferase family 4 protein n=1 Tax=Rubellimicrobium aerolatum TaxID=490979 RepID=A0ABW0S940_9RHOB|nr:glycosyltransferase family 4 protein [Rubellimicrobium aerolatum]MBP1804814.1 glycosyltransferase involved in cell wall biosynthesis [Rubellimicrobium aerolatum]